MKIRAFLGALAALAIVAAACSTGSVEADERITDTFTRVVVQVGAGDVTVERTTGRSEWFATADFSGDRPAFEPRVVDGELIVDDGCDSADCSVLYTIRVPEGVQVTARSGSGDVTVTEIEGAVSVETGSGTVFLNTVKGLITVETGSGDIVGTRLEAATATFEAGSGNIDVAFENIIASLFVETGSGNVTAQLAGGPYNLDAATGSGSTDFKIDDDDTSPNVVTLKTGSGDLTVYKQ